MINLDEISYSFKWMVVMTVKNKKRNIIWAAHAVQTYGTNAKQVIELATNSLPRHFELKKIVKAKPLGLAFAFYKNGDMDFIPTELHCKIPTPSEYINNEEK